MIVEEITKEIASLLKAKNEAYGNSVGKTASIIRTLYGNSIPEERYDDLHYVIRILDKLSRIASGDPSAFQESPWLDLAGYAILRLAELKDERGEK